MFITRKEFNRYQAKMDAIIDVQDERLEFLDEKLTSLAKELGYEWTSGAVKEEYRSPYTGILVEEKAVLKWGWKKIKEDDFTEEWERQAKIKKK